MRVLAVRDDGSAGRQHVPARALVCSGEAIQLDCLRLNVEVRETAVTAECRIPAGQIPGERQSRLTPNEIASVD
jgi:hypothetical protein